MKPVPPWTWMPSERPRPPDVGGEGLGDRVSNAGALVGRLAGGGIAGEAGAIERHRGRKADGARCRVSERMVSSMRRTST